MEVDVLESELLALDRKRSSCNHAKELALSLQNRSGMLRQEAQVILADLRQARMILSTTKAKLEAIATELSECGYVRTRREIAMRLRETVNMLQGSSTNRSMKLNEATVAKAIRELVQIEGRTPQVLSIMVGAAG